MLKFAEIVNDTIPSYRIDQFSERYNEVVLKMTKLTMNQNDSVLKELNVT